MRKRFLPLALAFVTALVLSPAGAAHADETLKATITCDSASDTISTSLTGGAHLLPANKTVSVEFISDGSFAKADTSDYAGHLLRVRTTTGPDGSISVNGFSDSWPAADFLFYAENLLVSVIDLSTNGIYAQARDSCLRDLRTTATPPCDEVNHTLTAAVSGTGFTEQANQQILVQYWSETEIQMTPNSGRFHTVPAQLLASHQVTVSATGELNDVGYVRNFDPEPYYWSETIETRVYTSAFGSMIGNASISCEYTSNTD